MRIWNDELLKRILFTLHETAIRLYSEDASKEAMSINRMGGWVRSAYCFQMLVEIIRIMELTRDILIETNNALIENKKRSHVDEGGEVDRVTIKAMNVQGEGRSLTMECGFCAQTPGANTKHWAHGHECNSTFMGHEDVEKTIIMVGMCAVCLFKHDANVQCRDKNLTTGRLITCSAGCEIQGKAVRYAACKHGIEARKNKYK